MQFTENNRSSISKCKYWIWNRSEHRSMKTLFENRKAHFCHQLVWICPINAVFFFLISQLWFSCIVTLPCVFSSRCTWQLISSVLMFSNFWQRLFWFCILICNLSLNGFKIFTASVWKLFEKYKTCWALWRLWSTISVK